MKELIERSYKAIQERGLIDNSTLIDDFMLKIKEEYHETADAFFKYKFNSKHENHFKEELTDLATVCFMALKFLGHDPIEEFEKVVLKNEKRANELRKGD